MLEIPKDKISWKYFRIFTASGDQYSPYIRYMWVSFLPYQEYRIYFPALVDWSNESINLEEIPILTIEDSHWRHLFSFIVAFIWSVFEAKEHVQIPPIRFVGCWRTQRKNQKLHLVFTGLVVVEKTKWTENHVVVTLQRNSIDKVRTGLTQFFCPGVPEFRRSTINRFLLLLYFLD